jgi:hypothetical protein
MGWSDGAQGRAIQSEAAFADDDQLLLQGLFEGLATAPTSCHGGLALALPWRR